MRVILALLLLPVTLFRKYYIWASKSSLRAFVFALAVIFGPLIAGGLLYNAYEREIVDKPAPFELGHGYTLRVRVDRWWEICDNLYYELKGPGVNSGDHLFAFLALGHNMPDFIVHKKGDGQMAWVTTDLRTRDVVFLIDFSSGEYWPDGTKSDRKEAEKRLLGVINAEANPKGEYYRLYQSEWLGE